MDDVIPRAPFTATPTKRKWSVRSLFRALKTRFTRTKTDVKNPSNVQSGPKSRISDDFAYERLIEYDSNYESTTSDANTANSLFGEIDLMPSVSETVLRDDTQINSAPKCDRCAAREARDAQTQTDTDFLSNSLPPFDPSASERGTFAKKGKTDAESVQNLRPISEAREFDKSSAETKSARPRASYMR